MMNARRSWICAIAFTTLACSTNPDNPDDPDNDNSCADSCQALNLGSMGAVSSCHEVCTSLAGGGDTESYILGSAEAIVTIEETYQFRDVYVEAEQNRLLASCSILESLEGDTGVIANFELAVPRHSADYFSFTSVPDTGQGGGLLNWGLYDKSKKEEWIGVPPGEVSVACAFNTAGDERSCEVTWEGRARENFDPQKMSTSAVRITCLFLRDSEPGACLSSCDDGNPCTWDLCDPVCRHPPLPNFFQRECDFGGIPGFCFEGECEAAVCGDCDDMDPCSLDYCDPFEGSCFYLPGSLMADTSECSLWRNEDQ